MQFEWDENKNLLNITKHNLNFEDVIEAFNDRYAIIRFDRTVNNESRYHLISELKNILIVLVVFTKRNNSIRIISARRANKKERGIYNEQKN